MAIRRVRFGATAAGEPVDIYTLTNDSGLEARVMTYGGTLVSLRVPDRSGKLSDVVLGFDTLEPYLGEHPYFGCLIGRFGNRIAKASFKLEGKRFRLPANDGAHHLHGGPAGFHTVLWQADAAETKAGAQLRLRYVSADGEAGYPGTVSVEVRYTLMHEDALRLDYFAKTDAPTVLNLTNHAYFNLAGEGTILDHELRIRASQFLPVNKTRIPTGKLLPVAGTAFDFSTPASIGERMALEHAQFAIGRGYDHCWVLDEPRSVEAVAAELHEPRTGRAICIYTTQPGLQFYSGNFLDRTIEGKRGAHYQQYAGLCLETQHFPDSPNQPAFPSTVLLPDAVYSETTVYAFSVRPHQSSK